MTFTDFRTFVEFLFETEGVYVQEMEGRNPDWVTIESIEDMDPLLIAEVIITAHDSGFYIGTFDATRYGGELTFYE